MTLDSPIQDLNTEGIILRLIPLVDDKNVK
jgi:hypothetical protein